MLQYFAEYVSFPWVDTTRALLACGSGKLYAVLRTLLKIHFTCSGHSPLLQFAPTVEKQLEGSDASPRTVGRATKDVMSSLYQAALHDSELDNTVLVSLIESATTPSRLSDLMHPPPHDVPCAGVLLDEALFVHYLDGLNEIRSSIVCLLVSSSDYFRACLENYLTVLHSLLSEEYSYIRTNSCYCSTAVDLPSRDPFKRRFPAQAKSTIPLYLDALIPILDSALSVNSWQQITYSNEVVHIDRIASFANVYYKDTFLVYLLHGDHDADTDWSSNIQKYALSIIKKLLDIYPPVPKNEIAIYQHLLGDCALCELSEVPSWSPQQLQLAEFLWQRPKSNADIHITKTLFINALTQLATCYNKEERTTELGELYITALLPTLS